MTPDDATLLKSISDGIQHVRAEADAKWGVDRLRLVVSEESRTKFDRQADKYGRALKEAWATGERPLTAIAIAGLQEAARRMRTAFRVLDTEATSMGVSGLPEAVWEVSTHDGQVIAFCRDTASAVAYQAQSGRKVSTWTPAEIANLIAALPALLGEAKAHFPGACVVTPMHRPSKFVPDAQVPF